MFNDQLVILALSINEQTLRSKLLDSSYNITNYRIVVITQGFTVEDFYGPNVDFIRDDKFVNLKRPISEIREYFTKLVGEKYNPEYFLFIDDDFKFRDMSELCIDYALNFMNDSPTVGLINFKMNCPDKLPKSYSFEDINPTFVYMRGGILVRGRAYCGWGGEDHVIYYEESYLATLVYLSGYEVMSGYTDVVHRTVRSGLGKSMEEKYKDNFNQMNGGRQCLHRRGYIIPQLDKEGSPNYRVPCKLSDFTLKSHDYAQYINFGKDWSQCS